MSCAKPEEEEEIHGTNREMCPERSKVTAVQPEEQGPTRGLQLGMPYKGPSGQNLVSPQLGSRFVNL